MTYSQGEERQEEHERKSTTESWMLEGTLGVHLTQPSTQTRGKKGRRKKEKDGLNGKDASGSRENCPKAVTHQLAERTQGGM